MYHTPDISIFTDIPQYIQGQWIIPDENPQYEDAEELAVEESIWPASLPEDVGPVPEDQNLLITPEPHVLKEEGSAFMVQRHDCR